MIFLARKNLKGNKRVLHNCAIIKKKKERDNSKEKILTNIFFLYKLHRANINLISRKK